MLITIQYEASWRNSFLAGSNNEPIPKNGREFIGSMTSLGKRDAQGEYLNFIRRDISHDTVMGVLNRLIGDQRKLYQSRQSANYYFSDLEQNITFSDHQSHSKPINTEMVYIRNMTGNTDQNAFTGMIRANDPVFTESYSNAFWGVLMLDIESLCQFINDINYKISSNVQFDPVRVVQQFEILNGLKAVDVTGSVSSAMETLKGFFPKVKYKINNEQIKPVEIYCSALYIQVMRLLTINQNISKVLSKHGHISGISKRGFTPKDFMNNYTTGGRKPIWGSPYFLKQNSRGEGELTLLLTKANGTLEINLNISKEKAEEIKGMIDAARVSSFYLGKKGLAYVDSLSV